MYIGEGQGPPEGARPASTSSRLTVGDPDKPLLVVDGPGNDRALYDADYRERRMRTREPRNPLTTKGPRIEVKCLIRLEI